MPATTVSTVYLVGLGALGSMVAARLHDHDPSLLRIVADGERIRRYRRSGVHVDGRDYAFSYLDPSEDAPAADLIVVAVKSYHLEQAIAELRPFVGADTAVLSLLNGIGSEEEIGRAIGMEHMLYAYGVGMDPLRDGTSTRYAHFGRIVFGERDNSVRSPRVRAVEELFRRAGVPYDVPRDMVRALWSKLMLNVGINQTAAVLRAPFGVFQAQPEARELMLMAAREVVELAAEAGVDLGERDLREFVDIIDTLSPDGKPSMLQDAEAGRRTEVELFAGTVLQLGHAHGVPTPVNDVLYRMLTVVDTMHGHGGHDDAT